MTRVTLYLADDPRRPPTRCWPAPASAPSTPSCSVASRRTHSPTRIDRLRLQGGDHRRRRPARRPQTVPLKANVDAAIEKPRQGIWSRHVIVVRRTGGNVAMEPGRDVYYDAAAEPRWMPTTARAGGGGARSTRCSSSTPRARPGQPKGVVHTTGGYLVYASMTHQYVFDYHVRATVYWCTADVGWVTGHSYIVYGPLANGATTLMFEGIPTYPSELPLLGRGRQAQGQHLLHRAHRDPLPDGRRRGPGRRRPARKSLRVLGSVGEPINPGSLGVVLQRGRRERAARSSTHGGRPRPAAS